MKVKIALILCLIFSSGIYAADAQICETGGLPSVSNEGLNTIMLAGKKVNRIEFEEINTQLCIYMDLAPSGGFSTTKFKKIILDGVGVSTTAKNANQVVSSFLNDHKNEVICPKRAGSNTSRDMHLFKKALYEGVVSLFDDILIDDDEYQIDFNGYEIVNEKKETVIDYLDQMIANGLDQDGEYDMLISDIMDLGGVRGKDL